MKVSRVERLLKLIGLLQAAQGYSVEALSRACGVSRRTTFRDLDTLRRSGVPLSFDSRQGRYHVPGTYYLPPTNLNRQEALALIVLGRDLGNGSESPLFDAAGSAAAKVESSLPERLREQLRNVADAVQIRHQPSSLLREQGPVYQQLLEAISDRHSVRIRYLPQCPGEQQEIRTRLSPYRLLLSRQSWHVIGRSSLHRSTQTFDLGRIRQLDPLGDRYRIPRWFSLERYLRNAWHLIPEPGPDRDVLIRFSRPAAAAVAEVCWHKTQQLQHNEDGTLDFRVRVSGLGDISWWVLGYGDQAEVLQPPKLREIVARRAERTARRYGNSGSQSVVSPCPTCRIPS